MQAQAIGEQMRDFGRPARSCNSRGQPNIKLLANPAADGNCDFSEWRLTRKISAGSGPSVIHPRMIRKLTGVRALRGRTASASLESDVNVQDSLATRASLLVRLRDRADQAAWREFVDVYGPLIYGFARKRGLQDADAADLMQDVLRSVSNAIGRLDYDPRQGRFRGWLFTITRNRISTLQSSRKEKLRGAGDTDAQAALAAQPDGRAGLEAEWELEFQRRLAAVVLEHVRPEFSDKVWDAFWKTAVDGAPGDVVARELGMSIGAVYVAKSRVLARVRVEVQRRTDEDEEFRP